MNPTISSEQLAAMMQPSRLDLGIATLFPRWGARRMQARREFAYEAARNTRLRTSATQLQGPEDYTAFPDRLQLIRQVRDLEQNFGLFQSIIDKLALYAFGRMRFQAHTGDKATNDLYEEYLDARFGALDISGRHNFRSLVCIAFKSMLRDGDFCFKWQRDGGDLKLVGIEGDRLGGITMASPSEDYFQGIWIDLGTGRPVSYDIWRRTKANSYVDKQTIPAADVIHYYDPRRYDQYRGITPFAPVINEARDLKELMEAVRIGTKFENYHAAVGYTPTGTPLDNPADFINGSEEANGANGQIKEQEIRYGMIQWAPTNSRVEFLKSDRPSGQFQAYLEALIRLTGTALNLPYGFLYNLSGLTGPSSRMDAQQAQRVVQWHQQNMTDRVLDRVKNMLLLEAMADGNLPYCPKWYCGKWQFPPAISIDAGRDSAAGINEWRAGLLSKQSWFAEAGEDAEDQERIIVDEASRTLAAAKKMAAEQDVSLELALTLLEVRTPNGFVLGPNSQMPSPASDSAPAPAGDATA